ncbi:MAG: hypothetical protein WCJ59_02805 [bacterium]
MPNNETDANVIGSQDNQGSEFPDFVHPNMAEHGQAGKDQPLWDYACPAEVSSTGAFDSVPGVIIDGR